MSGHDELRAAIGRLRASAATRGLGGRAMRADVDQLTDRLDSLTAEVERLREDVGRHDPTGADHMEEMWRHAQRADAAEAEVERLRANWTDLSERVEMAAMRITSRAIQDHASEADRLRLDHKAEGVRLVADYMRSYPEAGPS